MRIKLLICACITALAAFGQSNEPSMKADSLRVVPFRMANDVDTVAIPSNDTLAITPEEAMSIMMPADTVPLVSADTSALIEADTAEFKPDSQKSLWYAALIPGLGQIYNRRYWKLPIVAGAAVGMTYAISWNNKYYAAYTYAYRDMTDNDPNTNYHIEVFGDRAASLSSTIKNRQQSFRRQRDLCVIIGVALYLLSVLDAYVDAELFNFDITEDISLEMGHPVSTPSSPFIDEHISQNQVMPVSMSWSLTF